MANTLLTRLPVFLWVATCAMGLGQSYWRVAYNTSLLTRADEGTRRRAIAALVDLGVNGANALVRALNSAREDPLRQSLSGALGSMGRIAVEPLSDCLLSSCRDEARPAAARALGEIGDVTAAKVLVGRLSGSPEQRVAAADALTKIGAGAVPALRDTIATADDPPRSLAADLLVKIISPERMGTLFTDSNSQVRDEVAAAVGRIGPPGVDVLISTLAATDSAARDAAGAALVKIGPPAVDVLLARIDSAGAEHRRKIFALLGQIGDPRAIKPLADRLGSTQSVEDIYEITWALGKIGAPAVSTLMALAGDRTVDSHISENSLSVLADLADPRATSLFKSVVNDRGASRRAKQAAEAGLAKIHAFGLVVAQPSGDGGTADASSQPEASSGIGGTPSAAIGASGSAVPATPALASSGGARPPQRPASAAGSVASGSGLDDLLVGVLSPRPGTADTRAPPATRVAASAPSARQAVKPPPVQSPPTQVVSPSDPFRDRSSLGAP
jgi:HEAT repeat protein